MTLGQKRAMGGWHEPLIYAGLFAPFSRPRAAIDNRVSSCALQGKGSARLAMVGLAVMSALSFAGAGLILIGGMSGW